MNVLYFRWVPDVELTVRGKQRKYTVPIFYDPWRDEFFSGRPVSSMSARLAGDEYRGDEDEEEDEHDASEGTSGTLTGYGLFAWPPREPQGEIVAPYKRAQRRIKYIQVPGIFVATKQNEIFEEAKANRKKKIEDKRTEYTITNRVHPGLRKAWAEVRSRIKPIRDVFNAKDHTDIPSVNGTVGGDIETSLRNKWVRAARLAAQAEVESIRVALPGIRARREAAGRGELPYSVPKMLKRLVKAHVENGPIYLVRYVTQQPVRASLINVQHLGREGVEVAGPEEAYRRLAQWRKYRWGERIREAAIFEMAAAVGAKFSMNAVSYRAARTLLGVAPKQNPARGEWTKPGHWRLYAELPGALLVALYYGSPTRVELPAKRDTEGMLPVQQGPIAIDTENMTWTGKRGRQPKRGEVPSATLATFEEDWAATQAYDTARGRWFDRLEAGRSPGEPPRIEGPFDQLRSNTHAWIQFDNSRYIREEDLREIEHILQEARLAVSQDDEPLTEEEAHMREAEGNEDEPKASMHEAEGDEDELSDERPTPEEELGITEAEPSDLDFVEETGGRTATRLQSQATPEERETTRQAIQRAKDKLAKRQREVFQLRWEEGWPRDEVADYLKIGEGTVKTHEDRIHAKFKDTGLQLPRPLDEGEEWRPSGEEETAKEPLSEEEQTTDEEPTEEQITGEEATEEEPRRKPKRTRTRYLSKQEFARYFEKPVIRYWVSEWVEAGHEPDTRPMPHEETAAGVRHTLANKPKAETLKEWLLLDDGQAFIDRARGGRNWPKCEEAICSILAPPEATVTEPGRRKPPQRYLMWREKALAEGTLVVPPPRVNLSEEKAFKKKLWELYATIDWPKARVPKICPHMDIYREDGIERTFLTLLIQESGVGAAQA